MRGVAQCCWSEETRRHSQAKLRNVTLQLGCWRRISSVKNAVKIDGNINDMVLIDVHALAARDKSLDWNTVLCRLERVSATKSDAEVQRWSKTSGSAGDRRREHCPGFKGEAVPPAGGSAQWLARVQLVAHSAARLNSWELTARFG